MRFAADTMQVPPNCSFVVDDAEKRWDDSQTYHVVHIRYMEGAFTDWPWIFRQAMTVLEPGGLIEVHGLDFHPYAQEGDVPEAIQAWIRVLYEFTQERGTPVDVTSSYATWLKVAGFEEIDQDTFYLPLGAWPVDKKQKWIGKFNLEATMEEIEAYSIEPFVKGGWSLNEVTVLIARVRSAYLENCGKNQLCSKEVVVTGRKPRSG